MFLDSTMRDVTYYGIGPNESYIDKRRSGRHGLFRSSVEDLHEDYIRPQENGSHADCDYLRIEGSGLALTLASGDENTFSFNASVYTQEISRSLLSLKHIETGRHILPAHACQA